MRRSRVTAPSSTPYQPMRQPPSFANTIVALEKGGRDLERVANVFFVLAGADTGDAIEAVEREVSPLLARHSNAMYLDRALYARIADLYARREALGLNAEQARVLDRYHTRFVRAGGALDKPEQDRLADNQRATGQPRHPVRAERAGGREGLCAAAGGGRSCRSARLRARRSQGRRRGTRPTWQIRHHAGALLVRELPAILRAPRSARENLPGLDQARRERRRNRQPRADRRDGEFARRAREAARLCELTPITGSTIRWPRRRRRRASCSTKSGAARAPRPRPSATRCRR